MKIQVICGITSVLTQKIRKQIWHTCEKLHIHTSHRALLEMSSALNRRWLRELNCRLNSSCSRSSLREQIQCQLGAESPPGTRKVTIIGAGNVGMCTALVLVAQKIIDELCLIDINDKRAAGEALDLLHACKMLNGIKISGGADMTLSSCSQMCIITCGASTKGNLDRLKLLETNATIVKKVVDDIVKYSPNSIILCTTNPVDVLSYLIWKWSGFPVNRVLGTGTSLETSRMMYLVSKKLGIPGFACQGYVIGEHGGSAVPVWSSLTAYGVKLRDLSPKLGMPGDPDNFDEIREKIVSAAYDVIKLKGISNIAIALCTGAIAEAILNNTGKVIEVSTLMQGFYGIDEEVFLSLPCVLNNDGVASIAKLQLTDDEVKNLKKSADRIVKFQNSVNI